MTFLGRQFFNAVDDDEDDGNLRQAPCCPAAEEEPETFYRRRADLVLVALMLAFNCVFTAFLARKSRRDTESNPGVGPTRERPQQEEVRSRSLKPSSAAADLGVLSSVLFCKNCKNSGSSSSRDNIKPPAEAAADSDKHVGKQVVDLVLKVNIASAGCEPVPSEVPRGFLLHRIPEDCPRRTGTDVVAFISRIHA